MSGYMSKVVEEFKSVRESIESSDYVDGNVDLTINASFSVFNGDMLIKCRVNVSGRAALRYKDYHIDGPNFESILNELYRRIRADRDMQPLCLPRA